MSDSPAVRTMIDADSAVASPRPKAARRRDGSYRGAIYEDDLDADPRWAMSEGSRFFEGEGRVHQALLKIARRLNELGVPYCVVGGMALFQHGHRRFTEDIDILVRKDGLKTIHAKLSGLGYLPPFERSKHLRDTELGVRIEFLVSGEYPGDGRPKPVAFPDPAAVGIERDGVRYLDLPHLVELKLASGMSQVDRLKDLSDVYELIKLLDLPADFGDRLDPSVRPKYAELWDNSRRRYVADRRVDDVAPDRLEAMLADGVTLEPGPEGSGRVRLVATDPAVARKYDLHDESEFLDGLEDDPSADATDGGS